MDKTAQNIVSVVIVTYNAENTIAACLQSIHDQSCKEIEIIVIDGASTDSTIKILRENDSGITYWKSERDNGIYDAMNKALAHISTDRVIFLGADDLLLPDFSKMLTELHDPATIYYANVMYKGARHSGYTTPYHQAKLGIFHQCILYPAAVFRKYRYNLKYKIAADYALNMQLHKDTGFKFEYKDYTIAYYNDTGISAIAKDLPFEADKSSMIYHNYGIKIWLRYTFRILRARLKSRKKE